MKSPAPLFLALLLLLLQSVLAPAQRGRPGDSGRVAFDNRSSSSVTIYQRISGGKYRADRSLAPGESFAMPAEEGEVWTVATPAYYRPVEMIETGASRGWGGNRVVISDSDLAAIGRARLNTTVSNQAGCAVDLFKVVAGEELEWSSLPAGASRTFYSYQGREWVVRDHETGERLDGFEVGSASRRIVLENRQRAPRRGGGGVRGDDDDYGRDWSVTMVVSNRSPRSVSVLKRTTFGSRSVGTIAAGRTGRVETEPGDVWRFEDADSLAVLETVTVPKGSREYKVDIAPKRTTAPPPKPIRKVTLRIYNETDGRIDIYRKRDGGWKHAKRINENRYWNVEFEPGQGISIHDPESGRVLETMRAPQSDRTIRVRGRSDLARTAEGGGRREPEPRSSGRPEPRESGDPLLPRPRDVLRGIFGRE